MSVIFYVNSKKVAKINTYIVIEPWTLKILGNNGAEIEIFI